MLGPEFDTPETYTRWNPQAFVKSWTTPQLTIHGGRDYRIPETHGIGAFTALQRQGVESKFLYFPFESHWVQNPVNSVEWHQQVLAWIDAHVQKAQ
jgi:dipeptidyl aminopeptidase/acylaminoacyl peptidase